VTAACVQGFITQVKALPPPETKEAREAAAKSLHGSMEPPPHRQPSASADAADASVHLHVNPSIPAPVESEEQGSYLGELDLDDGGPQVRPRQRRFSCVHCLVLTHLCLVLSLRC
jgi:hypothetical protein